MEILTTVYYGSLNNVDDRVIHIFDVFDQAFLDSLAGKPKTIISDHFSQVEFDTSIQFLCVPLIAEKEFEQLRVATMSSNVNTETCFNFIINKRQINRYLLLKLVEYFNLSSYGYTWSGIGQCRDMSDLIHQIEQFKPEIKMELLKPVNIKPRWISCGKEHILNDFIAMYGSNLWTWDNGLNHVFENSCVSLISESVWDQRGSVFTEKTLYSVLGLTLPIWIGGYNQAREWKRMGFDIFDDVIDHSYQNCDLLLERCYHAFNDNLNILTDLELARKTRQELMPRLLKNRDLLFSGHLTQHNTKIMDSWPLEIQQGFKKILDIVMFPRFKEKR
jgi:hypothetical protein